MRRLKLAIVFAFAAFGGINPAFATNGCVTSGGGDDGLACDITASVVQVVPPPGEGTPSVALSNSTQTNYVRYRVTLNHYADRPEAFSQIRFVADTVVNAAGAGAANFIETTAATATVANNVGGALNNGATACVITTTHLECTFNFNTPGFNGNLPQATITFDVTVQSPTASAAGSLDLKTTTTYTEAGSQPEPEYFSLTSTTNLTVPDPNVVATYVPTAGTVKTGTNQGAATCTQPWVTIVKVPEAAQVGIDLNPFTDQVFTFYSTIGIPDLTDPLGAPKLFGVGTHWYDPGAASRLVVMTLRRDVCTVLPLSSDPVKKALHILQEKIYYQPAPTVADPFPSFRQVLLCIVTSGPTPGNPCIVFAQVYTKYTLPKNVPNPNDYLGDHEWVILSNENGKWGAP